MSNYSFSDMMSGIALVVSVASPMVTALINSRSQRKIKEMELIDIRRSDAIAAYIQATGAYIQDPRTSTAAAYGSAYGEIFLYAPETLWMSISGLNDKIVKRDTVESMYQDFSAICMELGKLMENRPSKPKKETK